MDAALYNTMVDTTVSMELRKADAQLLKWLLSQRGVLVPRKRNAPVRGTLSAILEIIFLPEADRTTAISIHRRKRA